MGEPNEQMMRALMSQGGPQRPELADLAKAYVAAWGELGTGVIKDANNPHFGNDYATLESCLKTIKPVFAKHDLAILQAPGKIEGDKVVVTTMLLHASGQSIAISTDMPLGGKVTAQAAGSAITYARRYQLQAIAGVAPTDDDGEAASAQQAAPKRAKTEKAANETKPDSYADSVESVLAKIEAHTGTVDEMEKTIRPLVEELGDAKVNDAYVAKRRALKGKK
jgi:hypothetical protein